WGIGDRTTPCSKLLARTALGLPHEKRATTMHPTDSDDIGICIGLVRTVAGIRERPETVRALSPVWNGIVDAWPELEQAYDKDQEMQHQMQLRWAQTIQQAHESGSDRRAHTRCI